MHEDHAAATNNAAQPKTTPTSFCTCLAAFAPVAAAGAASAPPLTGISVPSGIVMVNCSSASRPTTVGSVRGHRAEGARAQRVGGRPNGVWGEVGHGGSHGPIGTPAGVQPTPSPLHTSAAPPGPPPTNLPTTPPHALGVQAHARTCSNARCEPVIDRGLHIRASVDGLHTW